MANVTNLRRNTGSRVLSYPSDATGGDQDHYVMFSINVQQKSKIDFGGNAYSTAPAGRSAEFSTVSVPRPPTRRLGSTICLYMPASLEVSHKANYGESEIGFAVAAALGSAKALGTSGFDALDVMNAAGDGLEGMAKGVLDSTIAPGTAAAVDIMSGTIKNNRTEMKFEGIDRRSFSFTFKMLPKSAAEAANIEEIVTMFRYHSMPEFEGSGGVGVEGRTMIVPSTFNIAYKPGIHLHNIGECALESVNVKFGGERPQFFKDHHPVETELTLQFKELDLITKEKVAEGY